MPLNGCHKITVGDVGRGEDDDPFLNWQENAVGRENWKLQVEGSYPVVTVVLD